MVQFRKYQPEDFIRIRDFLVSTYKKTGIPYNWLIDRWNFVRYFAQVIHDTYETWPDTVGIWEDGCGDIAAVVCSEGENRGEAFFQMAEPELPEAMLREMFAFAEDTLMKMEDGIRKMHLRIPENAPGVAAMAAARGYRVAGWQETWTSMKLNGPFPIQLPQGFAVKSGADLTEEAQGTAHANAFGYSGSEYALRSPKCYSMMKQAPDYRPDLDLAVVSPEGKIVSFCTLWYDSGNQIAILEPVGTHAGYRKMGLGKAVIYEGLNRIQAYGAKRVFVGSDQPFYLRIGFERVFQHPVWEKSIDMSPIVKNGKP